MNKQELENNLKEIIELYNNLQSSLHDLLKGVKNPGNERVHLDEFLDFIGIEKNDETRLVAYSRMVDLSENGLVLYLENNSSFSDDIKKEKIDLSYKYVADFHTEIQAVIISVIESKNLLTPFYLEILKGTANVGLAFNDLFLPRRNHIINGINKDLEKEFKNDSDKIMDYLNENNLFDKGHNGEIADRSYSALIVENGKYVSKSYNKIFPNEIKNIANELELFIKKISLLEDDIYDAKENYISYLKAIKIAFLETNTNLLIEKWSKVDEAWMSIKTPFQICHPLEFYEDKYRKAVAPEWDLRIQNNVFHSDVEGSILSMYEEFYDELGRDKFRSSYEFSLSNFKRVQLHLSSPILYYSSELTGLFSAQVVPNDERISKLHGKKIFAFPEMVLENKKSEPFLKMQSVIFEETLLNNYRKIIFSSTNIFYKIYDIETIGHEYGHTLWLDMDSEYIMNKKTGSFKNIEEFKATTGGLVMYFLNEEIASNLQKELMIVHIIRCIGLLKYKKVNEVEPYYCESLIHLEILFESGVIKINNNKVELDFTDKNYSKLKSIYIKHYKKLIKIYLNKIDAGKFLDEYTIKKDGYYLPKNNQIRDFVEYYYDTYNKIGNKIDDIIDKDDYIK